MREREDFSADLILVCGSMSAGGVQRVAATLVNAWSRRGRDVCLITLNDRERLYALDPAVRHVVVDRAGMIDLVEFLKWLRERLPRLRVPAFLRFPLLADAFYRLSFSLLLACDDALRRRLGEAARERVAEYELPRSLAVWESVIGLAR